MRVESCDVLCLGGGGAGITAAVTAAEYGANVILVSKEPLGYGDTRISMGLTSFPGVVEGDSLELFYQDLLKGGEYLNDPELAWIMAEMNPFGVQLLESYGHLFQRNNKGLIGSDVAYLIGGHSLPRSIGCPPGGGISMGNALRAGAARSNIRVFEEVLASSLLCSGEHVAGAVCFDICRGEVFLIRAGAVIIATGGAGWLYYPHTDCNSGVNGDGYALAYNVGAKLIDMEQVQFMPFGLTHPASVCGVYVGEPSLAAPKGLIRNRNGEVILSGLGTMTRAQVTNAMAVELSRGGGTEYGGLLLDLEPNLALPEGRQMWNVRKERGQLNIVRFAYGEDAYRWKKPWDVTPTAHYFMGGIMVNTSGQSSVPGLYAAGQAMGGIHGANRLGSVSLAELFVFGYIAGKAAAKECIGQKPLDCSQGQEEAAGNIKSLSGRKGLYSPLVLQRRLQKTMWENVGIARVEKGLRTALKEIEEIEETCENLKIASQISYNRDIVHTIEIKHMLTVAKLITEAALMRCETRGAHLRLDFPEKDEKNWRRNIIVFKENNNFKIQSEAVKF
ncbi:MAG: FAD-binding protein [Bacillota bacterium]|nr:FAD-binding protein [Bacillota bacterium]